MGKKKRIISYMLSIVLTLFLSATILFANVNAVILNTSNAKNKIEKANYYEEVYNIVISSCNNYIIQSGFEETILNDVISKADVEKDVTGLVEYMYEGKEYSIQTNSIKERLHKNIEEYIAQNDYAVSEENKKDIDQFEKAIVDIYSRNVEYSKDTVKTIAKYIKKIKTVFMGLTVLFAVLAVIIFVIIYRISKPVAGVGLFATGALFVAINCITGVNVAINNILVLNRALSDALVSIVNQLLQNLFVIGIVLCVIGLVWIISYEMKRQIKKMLLLEEHSQVIR